MNTIQDVRRIVAELPRSYEVLVRDRVKFRVGQYVYLAFSTHLGSSVVRLAYSRSAR